MALLPLDPSSSSLATSGSAELRPGASHEPNGAQRDERTVRHDRDHWEEGSGGKARRFKKGDILNSSAVAAARLRAGEPEAQRIIIDADRALADPINPVAGDYSPSPYYLPGHDGVPDPNRDLTQVNQLKTFATDVNALCEAYALTGQTKYADRAVALANAWAGSMTPGFANTQSQIDTYTNLSVMLQNLQVLKRYPGWAPQDRAHFLHWTRTFARAAEAIQKPNNNFADWRCLFVASAAELLDDPQMFGRQVEQWKQNLVTQVDPQTHLLPMEARRARSLWYHTFALKPMLGVAELARDQGIDLYGYTGPQGQSLEKCLATLAPYLRQPQTWPHQQLVPVRPLMSVRLLQLAKVRYPQSQAIAKAADQLLAKASQDPNWQFRADGELQGGSYGDLPLPDPEIFGEEPA